MAIKYCQTNFFSNTNGVKATEFIVCKLHCKFLKIESNRNSATDFS